MILFYWGCVWKGVSLGPCGNLLPKSINDFPYTDPLWLDPSTHSQWVNYADVWHITLFSFIFKYKWVNSLTLKWCAALNIDSTISWLYNVYITFPKHKLKLNWDIFSVEIRHYFEIKHSNQMYIFHCRTSKSIYSKGPGHANQSVPIIISYQPALKRKHWSQQCLGCEIYNPIWNSYHLP